MSQSQSRFSEIVEKLWPRTRTELEKGIDQTRKMIDQGEKHIRSLSEQGIANARKLSLSIQRQKLYYDLGRLLSKSPKAKWGTNRQIEKKLKSIKVLNREICRLK